MAEQHAVLLELELDADDWNAVQEAFARRQAFGVLPEGGVDLPGRLVAEICRGWLELLDHRPRGDA